MEQDKTGWKKMQHDDVFYAKMNKRYKKNEKYIHNKQGECYQLEKQDHIKKSLFNKGEPLYFGEQDGKKVNFVY